LTADARSLVASDAGWRMVTFKDGEMRVVRRPAVASSVTAHLIFAHGSAGHHQDDVGVDPHDAADSPTVMK
jgi:hypothetical protein